MDLKKININETVDKAKKLLEKEENISPALRAIFEVLLMVIVLMAERLSLNSRNSSKPPSSDPNRKKKNKNNSNNKPGGQKGRFGTTLKPISNPDKTVTLELDKSLLPNDGYKLTGYESRQVVDIEISRIVTEYKAEIWQSPAGKRIVASFPKGITRSIQYGQSVKAHAVYLSQFQLMPYDRLKDYFASEVGIPVSVGSLFNFNTEAYECLEKFDALAKKRLQNANLLHLDETGINVNGKRIWLHNASNDLWTYLSPHAKRGKEAMDDMGILPQFGGVMLHDNWKPYFAYDNQHALCNAHHLRELENLVENYDCQWAKDMQQLLLTINDAVKESAKNQLDGKQAERYRVQYEEILKKADKESPPPEPEGDKKKRGRPKKSKDRNLYERLRDRADDVLRFMYVDYVPFTNNQGENDIRMTKVQQKISGCFKSMDGAKIFCRIRSYLITARKHGMTPTDALKSIFDGRIPDVLLCDSGAGE